MEEIPASQGAADQLELELMHATSPGSGRTPPVSSRTRDVLRDLKREGNEMLALLSEDESDGVAEALSEGASPVSAALRLALIKEASSGDMPWLSPAGRSPPASKVKWGAAGAMEAVGRDDDDVWGILKFPIPSYPERGALESREDADGRIAAYVSDVAHEGDGGNGEGVARTGEEGAGAVQGEQRVGGDEGDGHGWHERGATEEVMSWEEGKPRAEEGGRHGGHERQAVEEEAVEEEEEEKRRMEGEEKRKMAEEEKKRRMEEEKKTIMEQEEKKRVDEDEKMRLARGPDDWATVLQGAWRGRIARGKSQARRDLPPLRDFEEEPPTGDEEFLTERLQCATRCMIARRKLGRAVYMVSLDGILLAQRFVDGVIERATVPAHREHMLRIYSRRLQACYRGHTARRAVRQTIRSETDAFVARILDEARRVAEIEIRRRAAAVVLQGFARGPGARRAREELHKQFVIETRFAITMQRMARGNQARQRVLLWYTPKHERIATMLQANWRMRTARYAVADEKILFGIKNVRIVTVQNAIRGHHARHVMHTARLDRDWPPSYVECCKTASTLARVQRGHAARAMVRNALFARFVVEETLQFVLATKMAMRLQRGWRCHEARARHQEAINLNYKLVLIRMRKIKEDATRPRKDVAAWPPPRTVDADDDAVLGTPGGSGSRLGTPMSARDLVIGSPMYRDGATPLLAGRVGIATRTGSPLESEGRFFEGGSPGKGRRSRGGTPGMQRPLSPSSDFGDSEVTSHERAAMSVVFDQGQQRRGYDFWMADEDENDGTPRMAEDLRKVYAANMIVRVWRGHKARRGIKKRWVASVGRIAHKRAHTLVFYY